MSSRTSWSKSWSDCGINSPGRKSRPNPAQVPQRCDIGQVAPIILAAQQKKWSARYVRNQVTISLLVIYRRTHRPSLARTTCGVQIASLQGTQPKTVLIHLMYFSVFHVYICSGAEKRVHVMMTYAIMLWYISWFGDRNCRTF